MRTNKIIKGLFWKTLERVGGLGIQFVIRIILARLLSPEHYGVLTLMMVFITIANVFVQSGFNTSLIQDNDVTEEDYSSVLWVSLSIAAVIYFAIFFTAPLIAQIYKMDIIIEPLRVLALMLFPGALNSVQLAKVSREMDFKKAFYSNLTGNLFSGFIGVLVAYNGGGLWALVVQSLLNVLITCFIMKFTVRLQIRFVCNWSRVKVLFSFGWKLVISSLLNAVTEDIRSLVIGIKYDADILGNYNQGMQFPQYGINIIQGPITSVMLPAMAEKQSAREQAKAVMKNAISLGAYIVFPMMAGMAAIATSFIRILLTDKWIDCVPYMRIYCLIFAFYPIYICNLQAINAMGRSDIFLKLELIKQLYNMAILLVAVFYFKSPMAIAVSAVISIPVNLLVNIFPNKRLLNYSLSEELRDIFPAGILSAFLFGICYSIEYLGLSSIITIGLQIAIGILVYVTASILFRITAFQRIWMLIKQLKQRK